MKLQILKPSNSLNKAYYKQSVSADQIQIFKGELKKAFDYIDLNQDEEYHKNVISDLLKAVYCKDKYLVNVNKKQDLVIRNGNSKEDNVGVILEFKKPPKPNSSNAEMITIDKPNCKAIQELVLYYLRERLSVKPNHSIKTLIATNIYEWFIFDEKWFDEFIYRNSKLRKEYTEWSVNSDTDHFYKFIASKYLDEITKEAPCTYIDLKSYEKIIKNPDNIDDDRLIDLYKILSPEHLLSKPFINDSNVLNQGFYTELLHIIGLEETGSTKKLIGRKAEDRRNEGSLLENTISILKRQGKHSLLPIEEQNEKYFEIGLELCITWLNRILFLKLLEGQIKNYHSDNDKVEYGFLNEQNIHDFDELDELFFDVLAVPENKRSTSLSIKYSKVPYLNSSLFEPTEFELEYLGINQLKSRLELPLLSGTILKDAKGKPLIGSKHCLPYLFDFMDSYDFSSDNKAKIQQKAKSIINASVLGLIFEKINGYKDGSFYTPGYITEYMCSESINRVVIDLFNEKYNWGLQTFDQLIDKIDFTDKSVRIEANKIIDSIKICDDGVGSGHYLVSALNTILSIKSKLKILNYKKNDNIIRSIKVEVVNDELSIQDVYTDKPFEYKLNKNGNKIDELQDIQEALFEEKRKIIENCLFGVDINPKSVSICRLRLWIELLKNSYYTEESNFKYLNTLPNIDINIKVGDSLTAHFAIDDKNNVLPKDRNTIKQLIEKYKEYVFDYKSASDKQKKNEIKQQIDYLKDQFKKFTLATDKDYLNLKKLQADLNKIQSEIPFGGEKERNEWSLRIDNLTIDIKKYRELYDEKIKNVYSNPFEWRLEFPEVLSDDGEFIGFHLAIGNPPYGASLSEASKEFFKSYYNNVHTRTIDTFNFFISRSFEILRPGGYNCYIVPNNLLFQNEYEKTREYLTQQNKTLLAYNLGDSIFSDANVPTCIYLTQKTKPKDYEICYADYRNWNGDKSKIFNDGDKSLFKAKNLTKIPGLVFGVNADAFNIIEKIKSKSILIDEIAEEVASGISTGGDKFFRVSEEFATKNNLEKELLKTVLVGSDIDRYVIRNSEHVLIYSTKDSQTNLKPNIYNYLSQFQDKLSQKRETKKGLIPWWSIHWPRYKELFSEPKIILRQTSDSIKAVADHNGHFVLDSINVIKIKKEFDVNLNFIVAILNSKLMNFVYQNYTQEVGRQFAQVKPKNLRKLFIPTIQITEQEKFNQLVLSIQETLLKGESPDLIFTAIDQEIYKIYELSPEEINIIEG